MKPEEIKKVVREKYGKIASQQISICQPTASCCHSDGDDTCLIEIIFPIKPRSS